MIVYDKFWETMKRCEESTYTLINHYNIHFSALSPGNCERILFSVYSSQFTVY